MFAASDVSRTQSLVAACKEYLPTEGHSGRRAAQLSWSLASLLVCRQQLAPAAPGAYMVTMYDTMIVAFAECTLQPLGGTVHCVPRSTVGHGTAAEG